ncbi:MAG: aldose 1-epimerase, partial [Chloroflexota bacterium]
MPTCQHETARHPLGGWALTQLASVDDAGRATRIAFAPEMGCNLLSFTVDGVEYLFDAAVRDGATRLLGTPVLYPTPNRVRDARMTFEGRAFTFPPNNGPNFIHGLVREEPWECDAPVVGSNRISATSRIAFAPGKVYYERFPIRNTLTLTYSVMPGVVRLDFLVANDDPQARLPFGLAIHPYFRIHGRREQVRLLVPAQRWMEATSLLPTGRLVPMEQGPADLRQPTPLSTLNLDDVFWGLRPEA